MHTDAFFAQHSNTDTLLEDIVSQMSQSACSPQLIIGFFNTLHDSEQLRLALNKHYDCPKLLASSCKGALANGQTSSSPSADLSLFCISDANGHYGVGGVALGDIPPREAASQAITQALDNSGVPFESPSLVWCSMPPGNEEEMLAGLADVIGPNIPVFGGSAADNDVSGQWQQASHLKSGTDMIIVAVLHVSTPIGMSYSSGYQPTEKRCTVTQVEGRVLKALNNKDAAIVYDALSNNSISHALEGGNVLANTTLYPLGREIESTLGIPEYLLSHPDSVTEGGALTLFSEVGPNTELIVMEGSIDSLVARAEKVVANAISLLPEDSQPSGVLMIYCAGCMLTVNEDIQLMLDNVRQRVGGLPVVGAYTFGEQGRFLDGHNRHGNLMISAVVFSQ